MLYGALWIWLIFISGQTPPDKPPQPESDRFQPDPSWKPLGPSLWFDAKNRALILRAKVAQREGALEHLLCGTNTKEHESILATSAPAWRIHAGLLATGADPGHPVRFRPQFEPPTGTPIQIDLEWVEQGRTQRALARHWVKDLRDGKVLQTDWVFAGSEFYTDPDTGQRLYAANEGDLFTVANFTSAILDLPLPSPESDVDRLFVANTEVIPPRGTWVTMILRPAKPPSKPASDPPPRDDPPGPPSDGRKPADDRAR
jgi:hypothetical protein